MNLSLVPQMTLTQLLSLATIELSLRSISRDAVFAELIGKIPELARDTAANQELLRTLQGREKVCSSGLGGGVAIPHARKSVAGLDEATIVFGRHRRGIPYGALDGLPVKLIFLLLAPTVSQHLQIFARLQRVLRTPSLRQNLIAAEQPEQVIEFISEAEEGIESLNR